MPLSELCWKPGNLTFESAAEEVRRLKSSPSTEEQLVLYGLYKQAIHGNIPSFFEFPTETTAQKKWKVWRSYYDVTQEEAKSKYIELAKEMIHKYGRFIVRSKYNSEVWSVDY